MPIGSPVADGVRVIDGGEVPASVLEVAVADEVVGAGELAVIIDVEDERAAGCVGGVDGGEDALVQQEPVAICVRHLRSNADDLAAVVDAKGQGTARRPGQSIGVKAPLASRRKPRTESGNDGVSEGDAHDLAAVVDVGGDGRRAAGSIDRGEDAVVQQEPVGPALGIHVLADDLAAVVDAEGLGPHGARDIDLGEDAFVEQEPVG